MTYPKKIKPCPTCGCLPIFPTEFDLRVWFYHGFRAHTQGETAKILGCSLRKVSQAVSRMRKYYPGILKLTDVEPPHPSFTQFNAELDSPTQ